MIFEYFVSHFPELNENQIKTIISQFKFKQYLDGEYLVKQGEVSDSIMFLEKGIIREFSLSESISDSDFDTETTLWILGGLEWVFQVESYVFQKPSKTYIQALTNVRVYSILKSQLDDILNQFPQVARTVIGLFEHYMVSLDNRNFLHKIKKAEKRLEYFENKFPDLTNNVKLGFIASFLNISQSELSRIRSRRSKNLQDI